MKSKALLPVLATAFSVLPAMVLGGLSKTIKQSRPLEKKLASIDNKAAKKARKNVEEIELAEAEFARRSRGRSSPEKMLLDFKSRLGEGYGFWNSLESAKEKYNEAVRIARCFVARHKVSIAEAALFNDDYWFIRERALVYVDELKKVSSKLSVRERTLFDAAKEKGLGNINVRIDRDLPSELEAGIARRNAESWSSFAKNSSDSLDRIGDMMSFVGESVQQKRLTGGNTKMESNIFLGTLAFEAGGMVLNAASNIIGSIVENNKAKKELKEAELELVEKIDKVEADRLKAEAFCLRADEINKSLGKTIEAYDKIFRDTRALLFPQRDPSKTHRARRKMERRGQPYFTESEEREIMDLVKAAGFLTSFVDAKL